MDPANLAAMEAKSRAGRPAVEAIGARIAAAAGVLDDEEKKLVGRWVKQVLAPRGWIPDRKGRVAPGQLFARGTIYRRAGSDQAKGSRDDGAARLAAARAILATMPHRIMSADELIVERHGAFEAGE